MEEKRFLDKYSGQSVQELINMAKEYRIDSIILAFESALNEKVKMKGKDSLSKEELVILSVEALEREVNNGGYHQFFSNTSNEYANIIIDSLKTIQCPKTARITEKAIKLLGIKGNLTIEKIEKILYKEDEKEYEDIMEKLNDYDEKFYEYEESIEENLFEYIIANRDKIIVK